MSTVSSFVSDKVSSCGDMVRDYNSEQRQLLIIENQGTILSNQTELILGQKRTLCAFKKNKPEQCAEFVGNGFGNRGKKGY